MEIDVDRLPANVVGEMFRAIFFKQEHPTDVGCYSTFKYNDDVEILPDEDNPDGPPWQCAKWNGVKCAWYWDGDGTLYFELPSKNSVINIDCKKGHGWSWDWEDEEIIFEKREGNS